MKVIQWLLNHDPALRPTAQEVLKSELLPLPQMEESELHEVLQHTMANVNGKAYRTMVGQLFAQNTSPVMDYTYDIDLHRVQLASFPHHFPKRVVPVSASRCHCSPTSAAALYSACFHLFCIIVQPEAC